jgi:toxin ParE1/3/4
MQVVFTVQAEQDLEEISDYIAIDNPSRAISFVREIREHCAKISSSPLGGYDFDTA